MKCEECNWEFPKIYPNAEVAKVVMKSTGKMNPTETRREVFAYKANIIYFHVHFPISFYLYMFSHIIYDHANIIYRYKDN